MNTSSRIQIFDWLPRMAMSIGFDFGCRDMKIRIPQRHNSMPDGRGYVFNNKQTIRNRIEDRTIDANCCGDNQDASRSNLHLIARRLETSNVSFPAPQYSSKTRRA